MASHQAPYADTDPDRPSPPPGHADWGRAEFKKKWYNDDDLRVFQKALHAHDADHPRTPPHP
ncbi:hypothetical protein PtA15_12A132 [Puccinia triticina]|nr:uncharacterized protein PtA15_12A132 [Puccinia triticina]WAQ90146.1 hypothetical protein PtA15_12A132 [Puccinia triticina]WAR61434.1 hypothetical protein PtB15_12B119 [Puccinia triticina]